MFGFFDTTDSILKPVVKAQKKLERLAARKFAAATATREYADMQHAYADVLNAEGVRAIAFKSKLDTFLTI